MVCALCSPDAHERTLLFPRPPTSLYACVESSRGVRVQATVLAGLVGQAAQTRTLTTHNTKVQPCLGSLDGAEALEHLLQKTRHHRQLMGGREAAAEALHPRTSGVTSIPLDWKGLQERPENSTNRVSRPTFTPKHTFQDYLGLHHTICHVMHNVLPTV